MVSTCAYKIAHNTDFQKQRMAFTLDVQRDDLLRLDGCIASMLLAKIFNPKTDHNMFRLRKTMFDFLIINFKSPPLAVQYRTLSPLFDCR